MPPKNFSRLLDSWVEIDVDKWVEDQREEEDEHAE